jgi:hypothetical protein
VQAPEGVEARRLKIYRELIFRNVEGFISGGFPVLRSLYDETQWEQLVQTFLDGHRCRSPYFLEISQEFISYLMDEHCMRDCDPPFMAELAHYEWVELALDVSEECLPPEREVADIKKAVLQLAPTAWLLSYQFPVHRIGRKFRPDSAEGPTYLVVYRDRQDNVQFIELNAPTARLLELLRDNDDTDTAGLLAQLAREMDQPEATITAFGAEQLTDFLQRAVVTAD